MSEIFNLLDLRKRLIKILETPSTTVTLDTNILRPPTNAVIPGLDQSRMISERKNGYEILEAIVKQKLYSLEISEMAKQIDQENLDFVDLLHGLFNKYPNLLLPSQVNQEARSWIKGTDWVGYSKWRLGEENPFSTYDMNTLLKYNDWNPFFEQPFNGQFTYKLYLQFFLNEIPKTNIIDYIGDPKFEDLLNVLSDIGKNRANPEDKLILVDSVRATQENKDKKLVHVSFDNGMPILAHRFHENKSLGIEPIIRLGYSQIYDTVSGKETTSKFNLAYQNGHFYAA